MITIDNNYNLVLPNYIKCTLELGDFGVGLPRNVNFVEKTTSPILPSDFRQQFSPDVIILSVVPALPAMPALPVVP